MEGGAGLDILRGGAGDDTLVGGLGRIGNVRYEYDPATGTTYVFGSTDADAAPEFSVAVHMVGWMLETGFIL